METQPPPPESMSLDVSTLDERLLALAHLSSSSTYNKQKSSLQMELEQFLASLPARKVLFSATPRDLCRFLVWKDSKGRTVVHEQRCPFFGHKGSSSCLCPKRLAFGTIDSIIGKLRAIFNEAGRRGEWDPRLLLGNPASDSSLKNYLKAVTSEQLQARTLPTQANPLFVDDLQQLCSSIDLKLQREGLSSLDMFILLRDQAFFKTLFFSGDRAGDLGQVKTPEILRFPGNAGLLFNHVWGKTLRDGSANLFGLRRHEDPRICPVKAIDAYVEFANAIGISLSKGFLFRPTTPDGAVADKPLSSSTAESRLKFLCRDADLNVSPTLHSFRSGCAITLAFSGSSLEDIMAHAGWKTGSSARHYLQLSKVMSVDSPSMSLSKKASGSEQTVALYRDRNNLKLFTPAFPI